MHICVCNGTWHAQVSACVSMRGCLEGRAHLVQSNVLFLVFTGCGISKKQEETGEHACSHSFSAVYPGHVIVRLQALQAVQIFGHGEVNFLLCRLHHGGKRWYMSCTGGNRVQLTWRIPLTPAANILHDALHAKLRVLTGEELACGSILKADTAHCAILRLFFPRKFRAFAPKNGSIFLLSRGLPSCWLDVTYPQGSFICAEA